MLLERKNKEVGKLIEETQKSINELAENINQAKVSSQYYIISQKDPLYVKLTDLHDDLYKTSIAFAIIFQVLTSNYGTFCADR